MNGMVRGICVLATVMGMAGPVYALWGRGSESKRMLTTAKAALEDGLCALAEEQLEQYLRRLKSSNAEKGEEPILLLVRALYEQEKYARILEVLKEHKQVEKAARDPGAFVFWRALALHKLDRSDDALEVLSGFDEKHRRSACAGRVQRVLAWCYLDTGQIDPAMEAFAAFEKSFGDSPATPENLLEWSKALMATNRWQDAGEVLGRLVKGPEAGKAVQEGQYWLGRLLARQGNRAGATEILMRLGTNEQASADLRADAYFSLAEAHRAVTNMTAAAEALSNGVVRARSPELKRMGGFGLGRLLLEMSRPEEGLPLLKSMIAASPDDPLSGVCQLELADFLLEQGRHKEAVDEFQHYLETFTNSVGQAEAHYGKGWGLTGDGRYAEAATAFFKAYELFCDPLKKQECLCKMGDAHFENGQYALASDVYSLLLMEFPESELAARALFQLAESLARAGDTEQAESKFQELIGKCQDRRLSEEAMLRIAELKESRGLWLEAIEGFNNMMNVCSNGAFFARALHNRGLVLYHVFRFNEALRDFERVVSDFSDTAAAKQAFYMRGMCHYGLGRDEESLEICREFVKLHPDSEWTPKVLFWVGNNEYNRGNHETAEKEFIRLADSYGDNHLADDALLWAGLAASKRKEYRRSIEILTKMAKLCPESSKLAKARFAQADALSELGSFSESILIFQEIINKYPNSELISAAWGRMGDCQFTLGAEDPERYEESMESYRVVANSSDAAVDLVLQAEYKLGRCLEKLGLTDKAFRQYYEKVIVRYFEDREEGIWHSEGTKVWFTRAALNAADIMEAQGRWRQVVSILERIIAADVPAGGEARERIKKIRSEHWFLFY